MKKKAKIVVNNKLKRSFGAMNPKTNKIEINLKAHKGDKKELASTIKHEILHVKHPKMTEKEVYKRSAKTKISEVEQNRLLSQLKTKTRHYREGAAKKKYKLSRDFKPGELFNKAKENQSEYAKGLTEETNKTQVAIRGLV